MLFLGFFVVHTRILQFLLDFFQSVVMLEGSLSYRRITALNYHFITFSILK